jgi:hypothetical protein
MLERETQVSRGLASLACRSRFVRDEEAAGSNPATPTDRTGPLVTVKAEVREHFYVGAWHALSPSMSRSWDHWGAREQFSRARCAQRHAHVGDGLGVGVQVALGGDQGSMLGDVPREQARRKVT